MMNSDSIDHGEISAAHATSTIGTVIVGGKIRVVKKEKKEENNKNNNNGIAMLNHRDTHTIRFQQKQPNQEKMKKKEKEENVVKKEENDGDVVPVGLVERNKSKMATLKKYNNYYADWKTGNWCWLSSDTIEKGTTMTMTNTLSQQECCVKLEDSADTNTIPTTVASTTTLNDRTGTAAAAAIAAATTTAVATNNSIAGKTTGKTCRSSESDGDGNGNGNYINGPPKKKLKMNNIKKEDGIDDDIPDNNKEYNGNNYNTDGMMVGVIKQEIINNDRYHCHHKVDNNIDQVVDVIIKEEETETDTDKGNSECKIKATNNTNGNGNGNGNGNKNSVNTNHNDDGYESWTEGSWCWIIPASSRGGGGGGGIGSVGNSSFKQHTIQHHDCDNNRRLRNDRRGKQQHNSFKSKKDDDDDSDIKETVEYNTKNNSSKNNDNKQDEDKGEAVREDDDDDDGDDDIDDNDYDDNDDEDNGCDETEEDTVYKKRNASNKNNDEDEINVAEEGDYDEDVNDEDDDTGYDSWTEGSWCWLLPNSTFAITNNKTVHPSDLLLSVSKTTSNVRVRHRTRKTKTPHTQNEKWNKMFRRLVAYQKQHQTTNVPRKRKEDQQLAFWVTYQRQSYQNGSLPNERVKLLNSLGFVWKLYDQIPWMEMYQRLVVYKKQYLTSNVPRKYKEDRQLAKWVDHQRQYHKKKSLSIERINYLESIGFVWKIRCDSVPWIDMYDRLVAYKQRNQSTRVPCNYTDDPPLGKWVSKQRQTYNKDKLSVRRVELLDSIKFVWWAK